MTRDEFAAVFATLEAAYGAQNEARADIYFDDFQAFDVSTFRTAALTCRRSCRFFPSIAELMAEMPGMVVPKTAAKLAFQKALEAATEGPSIHDSFQGTMPTGQFLDDLTFDAVGSEAGLKRLLDCSDDVTRLSFAERDFCDRYEALARDRFGGGVVPAAALEAPRQQSPRLLQAVNDPAQFTEAARWSPFPDVPISAYTEPDQPTRREPERRIVERHVMPPFDLRSFRFWREQDVPRYHAEVARWKETRGWDPEPIINGAMNA